MPWRAMLNEPGKFVELYYEGRVLPAELVAALEMALSLSRQAGVRAFLADCSQLTGGHSVVDLYGLLDLMENLRFPLPLWEAVILPSLSGPLEDVRFWETAASNRGFMVKVFSCRAEAIAWLAPHT